MLELARFSTAIDQILNARYAPDVEKYLKDFFGGKDDSSKIEFLLTALIDQVSDPLLNTIYPPFSQFKIPPSILDKNKVVRTHIKKLVTQLLAQHQQTPLPVQAIEAFFSKQHENIKWAQNRWLIASPGLGLEFLTISEQLHPDFLKWLKEKFNVKVGDPVVHLHVISNRGRQRLKDMGISVPYDHWHEAYFKEMDRQALEIIQSWSACKGLFCDSSWVFNPTNFAIAPDGKPFVAFTFLSDPILCGYLFDVTKLISEADFKRQEVFALRSERRKKYFDQGIFDVKVFGTFYPVAEMIKNQQAFSY